MNRIKELRTQNKIKQTELCKRLGVSQAALSGWETGKYEPDVESLKVMADIFNVSVDYLLGGSSLRKKGIRINVYGSVPAGIPIEAVEDIIDWEEIPTDWTKDGQEYIALRVKGESMYPKYIDGDIVIVKLQPNCESGQDSIVYVNGYDATLKRVIKKENTIILQPLNPEFETKIYGPEDEEIKILGVVVELRRKI